MEEKLENLPTESEGKSEELSPTVAPPAETPVEVKVEFSPETEMVTEVVPKPAVVEEKVEEAEGEPTAVEEKPVVGDKKWFVIQALTGQEDKVKMAIEQTIEIKSLKNKVFQVLVPMEEIVEIKGGKRLKKIKKMFPGYVFLEMILDEESWYLIRETTGVARFIGTKVKPTPVSEKEMQRVLKQLGKEEKLEITFEKGEGVRVISGPFRGYTGTVDEVNPEKGKLKVLINIFGRDTPVEVNFEHAQKIV